MKSIVEQSGYAWVNMPRETITLFSLLEKSDTGNFFKNLFSSSVDTLGGDLFDIFSGRGIRPDTHASEMPEFKGKDVYNSNASFSLNGLKNLEFIGKANASSKISNAKKMLYDFESFTFEEVNLITLETQFLNRQQPTTKESSYLEKLRNGKIYIVTSILQSSSFSIQDVSDFEIKGDLDASLLEGYVSKLQTSGQSSSEENAKLSYKSDKPITFAIKACKLKYEKERNIYHISSKPLKSVRGENDLEVERIEGEIS